MAMRMEAKEGRSGFVLLSTMFVVLVLGMLVRIAISRMPVVTTSAALTSAQERASRAAESGADYVSAQLREKPNWKAETTSERLIVNHPSLVVREELGNVIGEITDENGSKSEFRIRFNYNDGGPDRDGFADSNLVVDHPYVSVNNLAEELEVPLPQGLGEGGEVLSIPEDGPLTDPHSAVIFVEGVAIDSSGRIAARRTMQSILSVVPKRAVQDGVLMGAGDIDLDLHPTKGEVYLGGAFLSQATNRQVGLRTKSQLSAVKAGSESPAPLKLQPGVRAELGSNREGHGAPVVDTTNLEDDEVKLTQESRGDGSDFYHLEWGQVRQASTDEREAIIIKGGLYVYGQDPADSTKQAIYYYDMPYAEYLEKAKDLATDPDSGTRLSPNLAEVRSVVNLEEIPEGTEISIDYSTTESDPDWQMKCCCLSPSCRGELLAIQFAFTDRSKPPKAPPGPPRNCTDWLFDWSR